MVGYHLGVFFYIIFVNCMHKKEMFRVSIIILTWINQISLVVKLESFLCPLTIQGLLKKKTITYQLK